MQQFELQSVRVAPWLSPSPSPPPKSWLKHAKQHKKTTVRAIRVKEHMNIDAIRTEER